MSEQSLGPLPPDRFVDGGVLTNPAAPDNRLPGEIEAGGGDATALTRLAKEQLARDIADIEHAAAVLRRAEPTLQSWINPAMPLTPKPRPLWLLIGVLWLSTALVTAGAVVAIASFAG
jgi:hypothetical protein